MREDLRSFTYGTARVVVYLIASVTAFFVAFSMGASRYEDRYCTGSDIGDCDPALGAGGTWAFAALGCVLIVITVIEVPLYLGASAQAKRRLLNDRLSAAPVSA